MNTAWTKDVQKISNAKDPVKQILAFRNISDPEEFMKVSKKKLHNPYKMKDMKKVVNAIIDGIANGKKFGIFGDYDCDGVSSTSIWVLVLQDLGADVVYYIPNRFEDGYGLNNNGIDIFKNDGVDIMITCDTGITGIEQVHYAKTLGLEVIVTDHHEPQVVDVYTDDVVAKGKIIKDADMNKYLIPDSPVVNIKRPDCKYPFEGLAGVGVSFKILCAVCDKIHPAKRAGAYQYMDLVALGTFADMMDLVDENRVIGRYGLDMLNDTDNVGLYQLMRANEITGTVTSKDVGWTIAPCINAAGRIVSAEEAVEMIISGNRLDAYRYAKELVRINQERKDITKQFAGTIIKSIEAEQAENPSNIIFTYYPGIPEGIIGLIAGRIMNHFHKPVIVLSDSDKEDVWKGSGRSIPGFNLFTTMMKYTHLMEGFGGHAAACGVSFHKNNFDELKKHLEFYADTTLSEKELAKVVYIDCIVDTNIIDINFVKELDKLEPFGNGNTQPSFMAENLRVIKAKPVGAENNHFWALLSDGKKTTSVIGWGVWDTYEKMNQPKNIDIVFFPQLNEYPKGSGKVNVQFEIKDLRKSKKKPNKKRK